MLDQLDFSKASLAEFFDKNKVFELKLFLDHNWKLRLVIYIFLNGNFKLSIVASYSLIYRWFTKDAVWEGPSYRRWNYILRVVWLFGWVL